MKKTIWLLLVFCWCAPFLHAAQPDNLGMEVFYEKTFEYSSGPDGDGVGRIMMHFFIRLRNLGEQPLVVARSRPGPSTPGFGISKRGSQPPKASAMFVVGSGQMFSGEPNIPSASELNLVTLKKGEATEFRLNVRTDEEFDENDIRFTYQINEDIAQRYGTWSGKLSVTVQHRSVGERAALQRRQAEKEKNSRSDQAEGRAEGRRAEGVR